MAASDVPPDGAPLQESSTSTTLWGGEQSHPAEARSIYYSERGHLTDWELTACERESLHMGEQVRPETDFVCGVSRGPPR